MTKPFTLGPADKDVGRRIITRDNRRGTIRAVFPINHQPVAVIHLDDNEVYLIDARGQWHGTGVSMPTDRQPMAVDVVSFAPNVYHCLVTEDGSELFGYADPIAAHNARNRLTDRRWQDLYVTVEVPQ